LIARHSKKLFWAAAVPQGRLGHEVCIDVLLYDEVGGTSTIVEDEAMAMKALRASHHSRVQASIGKILRSVRFHGRSAALRHRVSTSIGGSGHPA
jgi:hypothetical protein